MYIKTSKVLYSLSDHKQNKITYYLDIFYGVSRNYNHLSLKRVIL